MLLGEKTAIVPLGMSCQIANQLTASQGEFAKCFKESFAFKSSFFNWLIADLEGVPRFLKKYSCKSIDTSDISIDMDVFRARGGNIDLAMLHGMAIWFFHEHPEEGLEFSPTDVERLAQKYEHLRSEFFSISALDHRVFIVCNAQNNLNAYYMWTEGRLSYYFKREVLDQIKSELDLAFPSGKNSLVVAMLRQRSTPVTWAYPTFVLEADGTDWRGDDQQWRCAVPFIERSVRGGWLSRWREAAKRRRLETSLERTTGLIIDARDERLNTGVGVKKDGKIYISGGEGFGLYGPYVGLERGFYEIDVVFSGRTILGSAKMEITCNSGDVLLAQRPVSDEQLIKGHTARLRICAATNVRLVEVRLWSGGDFHGEVERIEIRRLLE